jgi:DNA ligase (NAD+)
LGEVMETMQTDRGDKKVSHPYQVHRVAELAEAVMHHKRLYYAGHPEISDPAYDKLESELRQIAPQHPALAYVGAEPDTDLPKIRHDEPMLSLQKTYDESELLKWVDGDVVVGTIKVDGVSLAMVYDDRVLTLAKTRGNGVVGEDVTSKIRWVPDAIPEIGVGGRLEIRGEIFCTESQFLKLADRMVELGLERPTSPRNIVAGLLGRKTHIDLACYFRFFAFTVIDPDGRIGLTSEEEQFAWLSTQGFAVPRPKVLKGEMDVKKYLEYVRHLMEEDEVPIDGTVFSYSSFAKQRGLGSTSHHPRYKMSFKWQGDTATSKIQDVTWSTSRLGIVTPVAVIAPVTLSGATITNVTLHNAAHVKAFNLKAGDEIEVVRSGEVIPKFLQTVNAAQGTYVWPERCPSCDSLLVFDDVRLKCTHTSGCPAQQIGTILNWIRCAGIDDLSDKRLVPLMDEGLVKTPADLYRLTIEDLLVIPQTKEKMATKLWNNIQASRNLPLAAFLNGLGIEGVGLTSWEKLLEELPTLDLLRAATVERIAAISGFAEKTASDIARGLAERSQLIEDLLTVGVRPQDAELVGRGDGPLAGHTFVITGALSRPRAVVEKAIKQAGGKTVGSVSKNTYAVVTDDPTSDSSKMRKARELGVLVWSETDLWNALGDAGSANASVDTSDGGES